MEDTVIGGGFMQGASSRGGGIIELEHPIHHQHQAQMALDPISLFDPSPVKPCLASDDEDEPSSSARKPHPTSSSSPWHRMKWTDDMVRLLIHVVASVGDLDSPAVLDPSPDSATLKRKLPSAALQKKGKWKTVSMLMLEKGCYVSPQQCEDKFNDLNKRYKKLNDILGRGTTCQVVENPALLDAMPHVPAKAKDDVRKILASKHLFYREMCAYHNGQRIPNSPAAPPREEDEEEEEEGQGVSGRSGGHANLRAEMDALLRGGVGEEELREWFRKRAMQLEEERVEIEVEGYELEKRRFKWQRFRRKKDRELERMRLENERLGLENERMALEMKQKEVELEMRRRSAGGLVDQ